MAGEDSVFAKAPMTADAVHSRIDEVLGGLRGSEDQFLRRGFQS